MKTFKACDDGELIARVKNDDEGAFGELFERYKSILIIHAYKKMGSLDEAADLVQELFATLWEKRAALPLPMHVSSYLYRSVRNRVIDWYSREEVRAKYIESFLNFYQSESPETDELVRIRELSRQIEAEISKLPPKMQEVFRLSRMQYLTNREISEQLDLSEHTVKNHIKKALKTLRKKLGEFVLTLFF